MARLPRLCIPGWPHLVVQRGHDRRHVFVDDADRALFRGLLQESASLHGIQIHAYGLRDDEVRLLVTPAAADSLSKLMQAIGRRYVATFNRRHGRGGGLWDGRFRATVVEPERHLLSCMLFVEEADGGFAPGQPAALRSSAAHHLGASIDPLVTEPASYWALGNTPFEREAAFRELSQRALTERQRNEILMALNSGWPLGTATFIKGLESSTERRLIPLPRGRPRRLK